MLRSLDGKALAEIDRLLLASETFTDFYLRTKPPFYGFPKHIEYLCSLVDRVVSGEIQKLTVSLPPGHGKSDTITRRLPVYWGQSHPRDAIVFTGYSQGFAERNLSRPAREVAEELGLLDPNSNAMEEWRLKNGARLVARGVGAAPTGINPISLLIADDPINSRQQAESVTERENIWDWWTGSIVQRFFPETRAIVIATRWHEDDLIGRLKATGDKSWAHVNLPAIAEGDDPLGREPGEALWEDRKGIAFLEGVRTQIGEYNFSALYQGNPTPRTGSLLKVDKLVPVIGEASASVLAFDVAASELSGDWSAACYAEAVGGLVRLTLWRVRLETDARNRWMRELAERLNPDRVVYPEDPGSAGKDVSRMFARLFTGFSYTAERPTGAKTVRAEPLASAIEAQLVGIEDNEFKKDAVEEFRVFPNGKHDDIVDAAASAFNQLAKMAGSNVFNEFYGLV